MSCFWEGKCQKKKKSFGFGVVLPQPVNGCSVFVFQHHGRSMLTALMGKFAKNCSRKIISAKFYSTTEFALITIYYESPFVYMSKNRASSSQGEQNCQRFFFK